MYATRTTNVQNRYRMEPRQGEPTSWHKHRLRSNSKERQHEIVNLVNDDDDSSCGSISATCHRRPRRGDCNTLEEDEALARALAASFQDDTISKRLSDDKKEEDEDDDDQVQVIHIGSKRDRRAIQEQEQYDTDLAQALQASLEDNGTGHMKKIVALKKFHAPNDRALTHQASKRPGNDPLGPNIDPDCMIIACTKKTCQELGRYYASDEDYARAVQEELQFIQDHKNKLDELEMSTSHIGRAWQLVQQVWNLPKTGLHEKTSTPPASSSFSIPCSSGAVPFSITPVAVDDMVPMAEKLIATQEEFRRQGKPVHVDIGYHWTRPENMTRIQTDGLLTKAERDSKKIQAHHNGSSLGDGIYTASDPYSFCSSFGSTGILVARLKGVQHQHVGRHSGEDTVVGNAGMVHVLATSGQCIPLLYFSADQINWSNRFFGGNLLVHQYHVKLQEIVDVFLNQDPSSCGRDATTGHDSKDTPRNNGTAVAKLLCLQDAQAHFQQLEQKRLQNLKAAPPPPPAAAAATAIAAATAAAAAVAANPLVSGSGRGTIAASVQAKKATTGKSSRSKRKRRRRR